MAQFIEKNTYSGSYADRIFVGGFASPIPDEQGVPNVGITKFPVDLERLVDLALAATLQDEQEKRDGINSAHVKAGFFSHRVVLDDVSRPTQKSVIRSKL